MPGLWYGNVQDWSEISFLLGDSRRTSRNTTKNPAFTAGFLYSCRCYCPGETAEVLEQEREVSKTYAKPVILNVAKNPCLAADR